MGEKAGVDVKEGVAFLDKEGSYFQTWKQAGIIHKNNEQEFKRRDEDRKQLKDIHDQLMKEKILKEKNIQFSKLFENNYQDSISSLRRLINKQNKQNEFINEEYKQIIQKKEDEENYFEEKKKEIENNNELLEKNLKQLKNSIVDKDLKNKFYLVEEQKTKYVDNIGICDKSLNKIKEELKFIEESCRDLKTSDCHPSYKQNESIYRKKFKESLWTLLAIKYKLEEATDFKIEEKKNLISSIEEIHDILEDIMNLEINFILEVQSEISSKMDQICFVENKEENNIVKNNYYKTCSNLSNSIKSIEEDIEELNKILEKEISQ